MKFLPLLLATAGAFFAPSWRRAVRSDAVGSRMRSVMRLRRINETHFEYNFEDEGSPIPPWEALGVEWPSKEWGPNNSERLKRTLLQDDNVDWFADKKEPAPGESPEEGTPGFPKMPELVLPDEDEMLEKMPTIPEWIGEFLGCDAPLDTPWRLEAEKIIRRAVPTEDMSLSVEDVKWDHNFVHVAIKTDALEADKNDKMVPRALEKSDIACARRAIEAALEPRDDDLEILYRHTVNVMEAGKVPKKELWWQGQFNANQGKTVKCTTHSRMHDDPDIYEGRTLKGKLLERNVNDVVLDCGSGGREVRIPNHLVWTVSLADGDEDKPKP